MSEESETNGDTTSGDPMSADAGPPKPLNSRQRRILGVLIEKARTTPDAYPLTLNGLVTGCKQKSNRHPIMMLTSEQIEDEIVQMREAGIVAEVHGSGRVPKYRHYAYDYLGVKGIEAGVMTELLLRGEQTAGDLRTRASRFEPIADLATMQGLLQSLMNKGLVIALTPPGRGQLFTHNLYQPEELEKLKQAVASGAVGASNTAAGDNLTSATAGGATSAAAAASGALREEFEVLQAEVIELRELVERLSDRLDRLES